MEKVYARTKGIRDDMVSGFCPGCMHSTVIKLIGEVLEEMHLLDKAACAVGVGCCGLHMDYITYDYNSELKLHCSPNNTFQFHII